MMSSRLIALIAEDDTDCDAIREIVYRTLDDRSIRTKKWASKSCGTLRKKLPAKLSAMSNEGCNAFIIVHDLDRNSQNGSLNDEGKLRNILEGATSEVKNMNRHICIPIEELEAWFWSDPKVIEFVGRGKGKAHPNPHQIKSPKEELIKLSVGENRKPRYSTNMNVELAARLNLEMCSKHCQSFRELVKFLRSL